MDRDAGEARRSLAALHQMLIDSRNGYEEAVTVSQEGDLSGLFRQMVNIRKGAISEIEQLLSAGGDAVSGSESIMSTVNRVIVDIRSMLTGLTATTIPAFVESEELILKQYDETIAKFNAPALELVPLLQQRDLLMAKVDSMRAMATD